MKSRRKTKKFTSLLSDCCTANCAGMDQYQTPQPGHRAGYATLTYPETGDHAGYSQGTPLPPQLTENSSEPGGLDGINSAGFLNRAVPTSSTADAEGEMLLLILEAFDKAEKSLDDT